MSGRVHAEAQAAPKSSFTPVRTGLLAGYCGKQLVSQPPLIQAKLIINQPNDRYEQEADRVADAVLRMPEPGVQRQVDPEEETLQSKPLTGQIVPLVQRQPADEDEEEEIQTKPLAGQTPEVTPAISSGIQSLQNGGRPLSGSELGFFEPRFGADFSKVRVHNDTRAASIARSVNARAFTFGRNVVFGAGEYSPGALAGRKLLAHELTHVVQQNNAIPQTIQRITEDKSECPSIRDPGEISKSRTSEGILRDIIFGDLSWLPPYPSKKLLIADFGIDRTDLKKNRMAPIDLIRSQVEDNKDIKLKLFGISDCFGDYKRNRDLRLERVESVFRFLDESLQSQVTLRDMLPLNEYVNDNSTAKNRAKNRGVIIEIEEAIVKPTPKPRKQKPKQKPKNVCGPDITSELINVLEKVKTAYSAWSWLEKKRACSALNKIPLGLFAWDINDLHNRKWIPRIYGPSCAKGNAKRGPCDPTVQVGVGAFPGCYHAGAVNYAIFGLMMKLCNYSRSYMQVLITAYKDNFIRRAENAPESKQWANEGYLNANYLANLRWTMHSIPGRKECAKCEQSHRLPFTFTWLPHIKGGTKQRRGRWEILE